MTPLKNIIKLKVPDLEAMTNRGVFLCLFLISFFIRFPFFFRDYIDRDESTFILMGQSWVNGHLPYTELWDLKPPLIFLFFAGIIFIFGKSFIAIRLAGVIAVAITAYFTFMLGKNLSSKKSRFWAGVVCVYLLSLFGSMQGVMSEHLCMLFFMPALYLMTRHRNIPNMLLSGLLVGITLMIKLNLGYAAVLLGLYLVFDGFRNKQYQKALYAAAAYGLGAGIVIFLTWLPYAMGGQASLWWDSVIIAPLEYASANRNSAGSTLPVVLVTSLFFVLSFRNRWLRLRDPVIQILTVAIAGVLISFIQGGRVNGHYLIQFHPIFLVLLALVLATAISPLSPGWRKLLLLLLLLAPLETYREYIAVARHRFERGEFFNGEGFTVPAFLEKHHLEKESVLFLEYHIGYWLLDALPPTKAATHPSNLCREELYPFFNTPRKTSMQELTFIMDSIRPTVVVTRAERRIFDKMEEQQNEFMSAYLLQHYRIMAKVDGAEIHFRSD
jgi:hypothetical protein